MLSKYFQTDVRQTKKKNATQLITTGVHRNIFRKTKVKYTYTQYRPISHFRKNSNRNYRTLLELQLFTLQANLESIQ